MNYLFHFVNIMAIVDLATLLSWYDTGQLATYIYVYVIVSYVYQCFRCAVTVIHAKENILNLAAIQCKHSNALD